MLLKNKRIECALSTSHVAKVLGVTVRTVSHYENNKRRPSATTLRIMAKLYNCNIEDLLD